MITTTTWQTNGPLCERRPIGLCKQTRPHVDARGERSPAENERLQKRAELHRNTKGTTKKEERVHYSHAEPFSVFFGALFDCTDKA